MASLTEMLAELEAGLCPVCHGQLAGEQEGADGEVLALPCGHVLRRVPAPSSPKPVAAPRPWSSGAAALERWERDHEGDES